MDMENWLEDWKKLWIMHLQKLESWGVWGWWLINRWWMILPWWISGRRRKRCSSSSWMRASVEILIFDNIFLYYSCQFVNLSANLSLRLCGTLSPCWDRGIMIFIKMELLGVEPRASCMLSTRSTNWAITPYYIFPNLEPQEVYSKGSITENKKNHFLS